MIKRYGKTKSLRTTESLLKASADVSEGAKRVHVFLSGSWVTLTAKMAVDEALKVLEISSTDARDTVKLKTAYRNASRKHHPDTGGDPEMMKKVNEAQEILEKSAFKSSPGSKRPTDMTPEEYKAHATEVGTRNEAIVQNVMAKNFKPEVFTAHFEKYIGTPFKYIDGTKTWLTGWGSPNGFSNNAQWVSDDGETIFSLRMTCDYFSLKNMKALGEDTGENLIFDLSMVQEIISHGRKTKFKPRAWMSSSRTANIMNPEELFPAAKIKKMLAGGDKKRAFSKRDMLLGIEKYLGGNTPTNGKEQYAVIPLGEENPQPGWGEKSFKESYSDYTIMTWHRVAFVYKGEKGATWSLLRVTGPPVPKAGRPVAKTDYISFTESDELLLTLRKIKKACANLKDTDDIARVVMRHLLSLRHGGTAEPEVEVPKKKPAPAPIDFGVNASVRNHIVQAMALLAMSHKVSAARQSLLIEGHRPA